MAVFYSRTEPEKKVSGTSSPELGKGDAALFVFSAHGNAHMYNNLNCI
jgi:hypothetical protein